jgi:2-polyprenyl-3-methyl-5-hydroxy-6-metoxy-1,4-benzoquinol methylase
MAVMQLKTTNPDFSFLIKKNPKTGMIFREIRKGTAYGWYTDDKTYNIYFKDADNEISFKQHPNESFEYLNLSRYNSPLIPLNMITEFLGSLVKKDNEQDIPGFKHTLTVSMIHLQRIHYIKFFQKHFRDFEFNIEEIADKSYKLEIKTEKKLEELIHVSSVLFLFFAMFGKEYLEIPDSMLKKYIISLQVIEAPFYIRNLFVQNFLNSRKRFKDFKKELEKTERYNINFEFGNTAYQRRDFIRGNLKFDKKIIDIGCGEGFYALSFAKNIEHDYIAVDIDESLLERVRNNAVKRDIENISTYSSLESYIENYENDLSDVILTEVIEHMPLDKAEALIKSICKNINFETFIITTPNQEFNKFYELSEELRHDDHKWEFGKEEFRNWISGILENEKFSYADIGDSVDGISTTQGVIIKRTQENGADNK